MSPWWKGTVVFVPCSLGTFGQQCKPVKKPSIFHVLFSSILNFVIWLICAPFPPPQMKSHFGPNKFHLPISCPLTAALGPAMPTTLAPSSSASLPPGYLPPATSYGGTVPSPLYSQQWIKSPVGAVGPVGLLGATNMTSYATVSNPGIQAFPPMHSPENSLCPKTTRTT